MHIILSKFLEIWGNTIIALVAQLQGQLWRSYAQLRRDMRQLDCTKDRAQLGVTRDGLCAYLSAVLTYADQVWSNEFKKKALPYV